MMHSGALVRAAALGVLAWACTTPRQTPAGIADELRDTAAAQGAETPPAPLAGMATVPAPQEVSYGTATGTLTAWDPATRLLTVRAVDRLSTFRLATDARVFIGNRRLPGARLGQHLGAVATVAFAQVGGTSTTHTVRLTEADPHPRSR